VKLVFSRRMQPASVEQRLQFEPEQSGVFTWDVDTLTFTPDRPWPNSQPVRVRLAEGAQAAGWPSLPVRQAHQWSFSIGQPRLAYLYPSSGPANIFVLDLETGESRQLTEAAAGILDFSVAPDGGALYYSARASQGGSAIYRLDLLEKIGQSQAELVLECKQASCRSPVVSAKGDFLAYEQTAFLSSGGPTYPQVWLLPLERTGAGGQSAAAQADPNPYPAGDPLNQTLYPQWSVNGLLSYYDTTQAAFVFLDPRSEETILFPNQTGQPGSWHPDGSAYVAPEIFFVDLPGAETEAEINQLASSHLLRFNLADGSTLDLTREDDLEDTSPAYSPGGERIAFARRYLEVTRWTPGRQPWLMISDGRQPVQLNNAPFYNHYLFSWSPVGDQLVYERFNQTVLTEPPEIWKIDLADGQVDRLVQGGYNPQWIP
jgi:Tol biopolymer transport system component